MADNRRGDMERCELCHRGRKNKRNEELLFHQRTDRGDVSCRVRIAISTCDECGAKSWDEAAETVIEAAVREAYDRLS